MPDYQENIENKTLLINKLQNLSLPAISEISVVFDKDNTEKDYLSFFRQQFESILGRISSFSGIHTAMLVSTDTLKAMEFVLPGNDTTYFYLPPGNKNIKDAAGNTSDFILFISGLVVAPSWIDVQYNQKPNIRHTMYYLYWDNKDAKIVCYGKASYTGDVSGQTAEEYRLCIDNLVKSFIEETPFRKHRNQW